MYLSLQEIIWKSKSKTKFDTITCFSTTKWIHLNWGDEGIKKLFKKVYDNLKPGGLFVVEPQLWKSYKKKSGLTPEIRNIYKSIQLKPDQFQDYLTNEVKFKFEETVAVDSDSTTKNSFERPLLVFRRPA